MRTLLGVAVALAAMLLTGCGRHVAPKAKPVAVTQTPLPDWAPKHPSPEFLRAAKVLKPLPDEFVKGVMGDTAEGAALLSRGRKTLPAAYEFFGSFDDRQIERFRSTKELRIPARSLTAKQRAALDRWFTDWRAAMKGTGPELEDFLLGIYKLGGKEGLSNVDVGFTGVEQKGDHLVAGHIVQIYFWVRQPGGRIINVGTVFAQM